MAIECETRSHAHMREGSIHGDKQTCYNQETRFRFHNRLFVQFNQLDCGKPSLRDEVCVVSEEFFIHRASDVGRKALPIHGRKVDLR
jgi:hypothetical protein